MGDVNWDNVNVDKGGDDEEKGGGVIGTLVFVVLMVLGLIGGGAYLNMVMLGERVRDIALEGCSEDATCVIEVRGAHADCFDANVTYAAPSSAADFQTPATSPKLGLGTVNLEGYRACVLPKKKKTLADEAR